MADLEDFSKLPIIGEEAPELAPVADVSPPLQGVTPVEEDLSLLPDITEPRSLSKLGSSFKREIQEIGQAFGAIRDISRIGVVREKNIFNIHPKEVKAREEGAKKLLAGVKKTPAVAAEIIKDIGLSYGIDLGDEVKFSRDRAVDKFFDAPISTTLDWIGALGVMKNVGHRALRGATKKSVERAIKNSMDNKVISDLDLSRAQFEEVVTDYGKLSEHAPVLRKMNLRQLRSQAHGDSIGEEFVTHLKTQKNLEQKALADSIKDIAKEQVNRDALLDTIHREFQVKGIIKEGTPIEEMFTALDNDVASPKLSSFASQILTDKSYDASRAHQKLKGMDDAINWNNPAQKDEALKVVRRAIRGELREMSPAYAKYADTVTSKLDLLDETARRLEKAGAGEKMGLRALNTQEEAKAMLELLDNHPIKGNPGQVASALRRRQAWVGWQQFFGRGVPKEIGRVPIAPGIAIAPGGAIQAVKKVATLARIKLRADAVKPVRSTLIGGKSVLGIKEALREDK